ncbi:unnamed protein product [Somion occarium]|uniref:Amidohydrolase-related domain-containing protein n=1 Tax=Somion occarium TaxID=3059160 RepID=A0ABP1CGE4_9APHY
MQISSGDEASKCGDAMHTKIYAGTLFDSEKCELIKHRVISVSANVDFSDARNIDLRSKTVLPGFVDCHVHFFLHPYSETSWEDQNTRESLVERTIRATVHARETLMAGYTAVRDLGTEGAGDADVLFRKCVSGPNPLIPGPRYFCANRAIVTTGSYGPRNRLYPNRAGVEGKTGAEAADGVDECIKVVRRQVGAGADWIKLYADYRFRAEMTQVSPQTASESLDTFNTDELHAIVQTAHKLGVKVAAHTDGKSSWEGLISPDSSYQVDSVEHGHSVGESSFFRRSPDDYVARDTGIRQPTVWIPTLSVYYTLGKDTPMWKQAASTFTRAIKASDLNVKIACGGDTGTFAHGDNSLEMKLMVHLGADWKTVLRWGTLGGWECIRSMRWEGQKGKERLAKIHELREDARVVGDNEVPFGAVKQGFAADIIATDGDLTQDFERAVDKGSIVFVMKGGRVYKRDGQTP